MIVITTDYVWLCAGQRVDIYINCCKRERILMYRARAIIYYFVRYLHFMFNVLIIVYESEISIFYYVSYNRTQTKNDIKNQTSLFHLYSLLVVSGGLHHSVQEYSLLQKNKHIYIITSKTSNFFFNSVI